MSTIKEYLSELSGRRVTVIGMGVSNIPLIKMLSRPRSWRAWGHG